jgi:hypothetical protein
LEFSKKQRAGFLKALNVVTGVGQGQESSMYGSLRDILAVGLGYEREEIFIDRSGSRGRPDLTIFAEGGIKNALVPWIVLEAKDEHGIVADRGMRAALFEEKAKYITADTAFFVMVDPTMMVARPVECGQSDARDIELELPSTQLDAFAEKFTELGKSVAGVPPLLDRFRRGDPTLIGVEKLSGAGDELMQRIARDSFFDALRETTDLLQKSVEGALGATSERRAAIETEVRVFRERFGEARFTPYPVRIEGSPRSREETIAHGREAHKLTQHLATEPALARLALDALPHFAERAGLDLGKADEARRIERFFAIETANLVLARILLIRFLEDHGFFDEVTPDGVVSRRYLCNGGVEAFQGMRSYFGQSYTRLLEDAYRSGAGVYAAAFNETELDWVLALSSPELSRMVEWAMYRFARYDFTTIRGDILTGVYDRFLDPTQRKAKGEFYTPPTIARWMIDRLGLQAHESIIDPACGSGTFLVERYQQVVGEDADRGRASYSDARDAVSRIAGSDLNPFSAVLTQIQLLWHLLVFGGAVRTEGLPILPIAERANSLVPTILKDQSTTRFGDVDRDDYAAVIGNPPYIRPERGLELDPAARTYFESNRDINGVTFRGVSVDRNIYRLFIYRALDHWCANPENELSGKLAFVVPLGFCSGADAADLRDLFALGGRWTIREIVDMELIWRSVFDADVLPMILIAEARPATPEDRVTIHLAGDQCVKAPAVKGGRPTFDLNQAEVSSLAYPDLFAHDGRILTRLTDQRLNIVKKLRACGTLRDAMKPFWTRRRRGGLDVVSDRPTGIGEARWEEQRLIRYGLALRGKYAQTPTGLSLFKGENIRTGGLTGEPAFEQIAVATVSSPSVWAYPHILPETMYAVPLIEQIPCAAPFNPREIAMLNTVIVMGPRDNLEGFPFDVLLASRIYGFYSISSLRASYMNKLRSHLYPTVIASLPWSDELTELEGRLLSCRTSLTEACRRRFDAGAAMREEAGKLALASVREVFRAVSGTIHYSEAIEGGEAFSVGDIIVQPREDQFAIFPDYSIETAFIVVQIQELADLVAAGLRLVIGMELTRASFLRLPIPANAEVAQEVDTLISRYATDILEEAVEREVDVIDSIVGPALGLDVDEVAFVQGEMANDPFLSRIKPRYPFFTPKQRGRRTNLERSDRYRRNHDAIA